MCQRRVARKGLATFGGARYTGSLTVLLMKSVTCLFRNGPMTLLCLGVLAPVITGCCSTKSKEAASHHRGWIGGEYKAVSMFPAGLQHTQKSALLVTALNTNTPAALAGLNEGDLILELDHQPAVGLRKFHQTIDRAEPGTLLPVKAWRGGEMVERNVRVGRETFTDSGTFAIGFPGFFYGVKLWSNAGFSLGVLGYEPEPVSDRKNLSSAEARYFMNCDPKKYHPSDEGWKAWLVIMPSFDPEDDPVAGNCPEKIIRFFKVIK